MNALLDMLKRDAQVDDIQMPATPQRVWAALRTAQAAQSPTEASAWLRLVVSKRTPKLCGD